MTALPPTTDPSNIIRLLGLESIAGQDSPLGVVELLESGLPKQTIDNLMRYTELTSGEVGRVLGVTESTIRRLRADKPKQGSLTARQGSQLWTLCAVFLQAEYVLGTKVLALAWLRKSQLGLRGRSPLDLLLTAPGIDATLLHLARIDTGVYV